MIDPVDSLSSSLIIADLADQRKPSFRKVEIDIKKVPARALSHMVWIPIGTKGSLVVVGGVPQHDIPGELLPPIGADEPTVAEVKKRKERAHALLKNVGVYDIAKDEWYVHGPGPMKLPNVHLGRAPN